MNRSPAIQIYVNDEQARYVGLSLAAIGACHKIQLITWSQSEDYCSIVNDDELLARTVGCSLDDWKLLRKEIQHPARPIFEEKDGRLISPFLLEERKKQAAWRKKSQLGGKKSGKKRTLEAEEKRRVVEGSFKGGADMVEPNTNLPTPTPFPTPIPFPTPSKDPDKDKCKDIAPTQSDADSSSLDDSATQPEKPSSNGNHRSNGSNGSANGHGHGHGHWAELFELFWQAYPKKSGKGAVRKWFEKKKPTKELVEKMLKTIKIFKASPAWTDQGGKFVPKPATWLNEEGWDDEPTTQGVQQHGLNSKNYHAGTIF